MNPAISVIFFTVTAGAGYGLLFLLALVQFTNLAEKISPDQIFVMGVIGLILVTAGLISSTFHLANPKNAWRSFTRFKTSWLSREAVFAVLFYPVSFVWLFLQFFTGNSVFTSVFAILMAAMALITLVCTAMIYASLKTIRQWHTPLTPVNYVLLGLLPGTLILAAMFAQQGLAVDRVLAFGLVVLGVGALVKVVYFYWIGQPAGPTINTAIGFTRATVKLLDVGHSSDTFHTKEFGFQVARAKIQWLRVISIVLAFVLPALLITGVLGGTGFTALAVAAISAYAGIFVERWLFFAEARHVVNLYHGSQRT